MKKIIGFTLLFTALLCACGGKTEQSKDDAKSVCADDECCCPRKIVYIQPYDNEAYFAGLVDELQKDIDELMPNADYAVEALPVKPIPRSAYYAPRNRYRADKIVALQAREYLGNRDIVIIGVTRNDISTTVHGHEDYGIMGLSRNPGNSCVVSSFRVHGRENLHKVVLHEFLHSRGLPHCKKDDPHCYMKDAKGKGNVAIQTYLCESCKGWLKCQIFKKDGINIDE